MVKDPKFLRNGRPIKNFSLLPREFWANWLFCAVLQEIHGADITFAEGTESDDGLIVDKKTGSHIITEHVSALDVPSTSKGSMRIIESINHKIERGPEYAKGKFLIVFFEGVGEWYRNKIRESINGRHNFKAVYLIGLLDIDKKNGYEYSITELHAKDSISFKVQINYDFTDYTVTKI